MSRTRPQQNLLSVVPGFLHANFIHQRERRKCLPSADWAQPPGVVEPQFGLERFTWEGSDNIPSMMNEFWWRFSWVSKTGVSFRSWINQFSVVYDSFSRNLKICFDYDTQFWLSSSTGGSWVYV